MNAVFCVARYRLLKYTSLVHAGLLPTRAPQRYYKYALLDPLDQPFATFRYYYRSMGMSLSVRVLDFQ